MILLANSPAGLRGPGDPLGAPRISLLVLLFPSGPCKNLSQKDSALEGEALQTSHSGVSQRNDLYRQRLEPSNEDGSNAQLAADHLLRRAGAGRDDAAGAAADDRRR